MTPAESLAAAGLRNVAVADDVTLGASVAHRDLRVGDVALIPSARAVSWAGVSGSPIVRLGRVNVTVLSKTRASPTGPWFETEHKVPMLAVSHVLRGTVLHPVTH